MAVNKIIKTVTHASVEFGNITFQMMLNFFEWLKADDCGGGYVRTDFKYAVSDNLNTCDGEIPAEAKFMNL